MEVQDIKNKYLTIYTELRRTGSKARLILLAMLVPGSIYAYLHVDGLMHAKHMEDTFEHEKLTEIVFLAFILWVLLALSVNALHFINSRKIRSFKHKFKNDLYTFMVQNIPEITDYAYNRKISPRTFSACGLFRKKYADYIGDDWLKGGYRGVAFELCELHVTNLFKTIFSGIFVHCRFNASESSTDPPGNLTRLNKDHLIETFELMHDASVLKSAVDNSVYLSFQMNRNLLDNKNKKAINQIEDDLHILKDVVAIIKSIIDEAKNPTEQ